MSDNRQAGRMILEDLQLFNQTVVLFEQEIEPEIRAKFSEATLTWAEEHGWSSFADDEDICKYWVAPLCWRFKDAKGDDSANPWFQVFSAEESASYRLADLCSIGSTGLSLRFYVFEKGLGFEGKKVWKKSLKAFGDKYAERLKPFGLFYDERGFHCPLKLDPTKLADAWGDDSYDELFEPLIAALDALEKAVPIFDEMIAEMRTVRI